MITELRWTGPSDNEQARAFFEQHPKGVRHLEDTVAPVKRGSGALDGAQRIAAGTPLLIAVTEDGATMVAAPHITWTWDGHTMSARRDPEGDE